jgi:hypothetical protein
VRVADARDALGMRRQPGERGILRFLCRFVGATQVFVGQGISASVGQFSFICTTFTGIMRTPRERARLLLLDARGLTHLRHRVTERTLLDTVRLAVKRRRA